MLMSSLGDTALFFGGKNEKKYYCNNSSIGTVRPLQTM